MKVHFYHSQEQHFHFVIPNVCNHCIHVLRTSALPGLSKQKVSDDINHKWRTTGRAQMEKERSWREKCKLCDWWPSWLQMVKTRTERAGNEAGKETILWKTERGLCTRQGIAKPAWGWERKTNPPHLWEIWKTSIFMMEKRCPAVCVYVCWPRDKTLTPRYNADISVITRREDPGGERAAAHPWTVSRLSAWLQSFA